MKVRILLHFYQHRKNFGSRCFHFLPPFLSKKCILAEIDERICRLQNTFDYENVSFVVLLFYVHGKHLRSCRDGQLT